MKASILKTLIASAACLVLWATSAQAQSGSSFVVQVPFEFGVAGKILPAGQYHVARVTPESLMIRATNGQTGTYVLTMVAVEDVHNQTAVVFRRYGEQYFLAQTWLAGRATGREVLKSTREKILEREFAARGTTPKVITLLANSR